ncbi:MAG: hypothetical protein HF973_17180 [Chloroflexi bacterium]|nr:hypothetical protein [Chloroflexota bacterium]
MEKGDGLVKDVFVLRLWRRADKPLFWRGEVQHVNSGEKQYVHSAGDLLDYLQRQLAETAERPSGGSGLR